MKIIKQLILIFTIFCLFNMSLSVYAQEATTEVADEKIIETKKMIFLSLHSLDGTRYWDLPAESGVTTGKSIPKYNCGSEYIFLYWEYEKDGQRIRVTDDTVFTEDVDLYPVCESRPIGGMPANDSYEKAKEIENERKARSIARALILYQPTISSAKNNKKKTITIKAALKHSDEGYEIQYSTSKKFKKAKKITIKPNGKKLNKKITKLKKGKTYYVRVRTYRIYTPEIETMESETFYSKWSKAKKVYIKK